MDSDLSWAWLFGVACGCLLGFCIAGCNLKHDWQRGAIQHGAAHYDEQTGAFTWNESDGK